MSTLSPSTSALSFYTAPEPSPTSPTSTLSSDTSPELSYTSQRTIPTLLGKSNFRKWHASINPVLLSNDQARSLISGSWFEPPSSQSPDSLSTTSPISSISISTASPSPTQPYSILHASSPSHTSFTCHQTAHRAYELANLKITRFIRSTLAMNVTPFVRQHSSAKGLYEQLIYLYGERAGIDMVGGPATNMNLNMNLAIRDRRTTQSSISPISEELDTSPMLPVTHSEAAPMQAHNRNVSDDSGLGYNTNVNSNPGPRRPSDYSQTGTASRKSQPQFQPILQKQKKKKVAFRLTNAFPFRRSSKAKNNSTILPSSSSKTILFPIQQSPASPGTSSHFHTSTSNHIRNPSTSTPTSTHTSPSTWVPPPLTPAALFSSTPSSKSNIHTGPISNPGSNTNPNPDPEHPLDFPYTPHRKACTLSKPAAGTQLEMTSMAADTDFEPPMEDGENEKEKERESSSV